MTLPLTYVNLTLSVGTFDMWVTPKFVSFHSVFTRFSEDSQQKTTLLFWPIFILFSAPRLRITARFLYFLVRNIHYFWPVFYFFSVGKLCNYWTCDKNSYLTTSVGHETFEDSFIFRSNSSWNRTEWYYIHDEQIM